MKKNSILFSMLLVVIMSLIMGTTPAQAATKKSAVMKKADAATKDITASANYYGWEVTTKVVKKSGSSVTKSIRIEKSGARTYFAYTQVTKKSGKKYSTTFKMGKTKYVASEVKSGLKKYSDKKAVKSFLRNRANKKVSSLVNYAKARGWTTTSKVTDTTKKATATISFKGAKSATATVAVARNKKSPKVTYKLSGKKSSEKAIKSWLEQNKSGGSSNSSDQSSVTENDLRKLAATKSAELTQLGQKHGWTVTTLSGTGTAAIKTFFKNTGYHFDVLVSAVESGGKAIVEYRLKDSAVDREYIVSWIIDYADKQNETTDPVPKEELVKFAAAEMTELTNLATAKDWEVEVTSGEGTTKIASHFANAEWQFDVTVEAVDNGNSKAEGVYTLEGSKDTKERIISWINDYAIPKGPEEPDKVEVTEADLVTLATSETSTIRAAAEERGWKTTIAEGDGTKEVSLIIENAKYTFPAKVRAFVNDEGEAEAEFSIKGTKVTKEGFIKYLDDYRTAGNGPDEPGGPDGPNKPDESEAPTAEQLKAAALAAWSEIQTAASENGWAFDTPEAGTTMQAVFSNSKYSFTGKVSAAADGKNIAISYYIVASGKESRTSKDYILKWFTDYKTEDSGNSGDQPGKPDDNQPGKPDQPGKEPTAEELRTSAEAAWDKLHEVATSNKWNSSATTIMSDKVATVQAVVSRGEKRFGIKVEARNVSGEIMVFYYVNWLEDESLATEMQIKNLLMAIDDSGSGDNSGDGGNSGNGNDSDNSGSDGDGSNDNGDDSGNSNPNGPVKNPDDEEGGFQPSRPRPATA